MYRASLRVGVVRYCQWAIYSDGAVKQVAAQLHAERCMQTIGQLLDYGAKIDLLYGAYPYGCGLTPIYASEDDRDGHCV